MAFGRAFKLSAKGSMLYRKSSKRLAQEAGAENESRRAMVCKIKDNFATMRISDTELGPDTAMSRSFCFIVSFR